MASTLERASCNVIFVLIRAGSWSRTQQGRVAATRSAERKPVFAVMMFVRCATICFATSVAVASCAPAPPSSSGGGTAPADVFLHRIRQHCGQAFAGRVIANEPPSPKDEFAGQLVMRVRECDAGELKISFHVGENRSRTWILTRTAGGLLLKHDHRHEDGSADRVTMYGGDTTSEGTERRQEFPVDAESKAMFARDNNQASQTKTWAMEVEPNRRFLYELSRPGGRLFRVEFDLSKPVLTPHAPWGQR
jgi:hypothetical protein